MSTALDEVQLAHVACSREPRIDRCTEPIRPRQLNATWLEATPSVSVVRFVRALEVYSFSRAAASCWLGIAYMSETNTLEKGRCA
ncbi:hypothetical protein CS8_047850 [Cupriavidus sp. 8B]